MRPLHPATAAAATAALFLSACGGVPPLTEDATVNVRVESPVPIGFYTRAYGPHVPTPTPASSTSPEPLSAEPRAEKVCDAPCDTPVTIGPGRVFWVGNAEDGAGVDLPLAKQVIVTVRPGNPAGTTAARVLEVVGAASMTVGIILMLVPTQNPDVFQENSFIAGLTFSGTGLVTGPLGVGLSAAFEVKADARPALGPK